MRRTRLQRKSVLRARSPLRTGATKPSVRGPAEFVCRYCRAIFHRVPRRRGKPGRFCSRRCARLYREEQVFTAATDAPRHSMAWWRRLRAYVRARDGFRCVLCGTSERELGRGLSVDHVYPRRAFARAFDVYAQFGTTAFVSVCPRCHARKTGGAEASWLQGDVLRLHQYVHAVTRIAL